MSSRYIVTVRDSKATLCHLSTSWVDDDTACVAALEDRDIRVPEDVAVTGFDDLPTLATGLTTVRQDIAAIAAMSVELLSEALAGKAPRHVSLPVALVLRETS